MDRKQYHREYMRKYRAGEPTVEPVKLGRSPWRDIEDWPGYRVNRKGEILSVERKIMRSNGRPHTVPARILSLSVDTSGYLQFKGHKGDSSKRDVLVAREVYKAFVGPIPEGWDVDHMDNDPLNNHVKNLQAVSGLEHERISRQRRLDRAFWSGVEWYKQHIQGGRQ